MATRHGSAVVTLPNDREILITHEFEAPMPLVWQAMTEPRHLLRWWGPGWCPLVACEVDFRVGGSWRYVSLDGDGNELGWHGTYREIEPPRRAVSTEVFEGFPEAESLNTMTLTESVRDEANGTTVVTTLRTLVLHSSQEFHDGHIASGMEGGMQDTFNRLQDLLPQLAEEAGVDPEATAERFRRVAARFTQRATEVPVDAWDRPAPPEGWVARDVVRHMVLWMPSMLGAAGIDVSPGPSVDEDPVGAWVHLADRLQSLLDDPEIAAREFEMGPMGTQTVEQAISMAMLGDVVIHTWDLARATGLDETLDPRIVTEMLTGMEPMDEALRTSGHYGPRVQVPEDSDDQTKLIAFTGRVP